VRFAGPDSAGNIRSRVAATSAPDAANAQEIKVFRATRSDIEQISPIISGFGFESLAAHISPGQSVDLGFRLPPTPAFAHRDGQVDILGHRWPGMAKLIGDLSRHPWRLTDGQDTWSARCVETRTPGAAGRPGKPTGSNLDRAPRSDPTQRQTSEG